MSAESRDRINYAGNMEESYRNTAGISNPYYLPVLQECVQSARTGVQNLQGAERHVQAA